MKNYVCVAKMTQQVRVLTAPAKDLCLVPRTRMAAHRHLLTPLLENVMPFSGLLAA